MTVILSPLLYDTPRVRRSDPHTSHEAADRTDRQRVEDQVAALFLRLGPMTDEELTARYFDRYGHDTHNDSPRKRRSDLTGKGLLVPTGETRKTSAGRRSTVWETA